MRTGILLAALGLAVWSSPPVELTATETIKVTVLADAASVSPWVAPRIVSNPGGDTFVYAVPPHEQRAPILPDYPWPLSEITPDQPPGVSSAPPAPGLILARPLSMRQTIKSNPNLRRVTANGLNMRSGPAKRFSVVSALQAGDVAKVTGRSRSGWVPVTILDTGRQGWVFQRFLAPMRS